jgi:glutamate/tyrosine decarboxylase-like PLP-dependent enzyme
MDEIERVCKKFDLWFMVDAAYGGPAAGLKEYKSLFKGMEKADSILLNPHKWMFVPFEVACVLVKNQQQLKNTFSLIPEYLMGGADIDEREDLMNYSIQLSKDFKALKVWMTIEVYGHSAISKAIRNDIEMALYAYEKIKNNDLFKALHKPELSIFCFKYISKLKNISDDILNKKIIEEIEKDGRVFLSGTVIDKENVLRINCINHRRNKKDIDFLIRVLEEIGSKVEDKLGNLSV